MNYQLHYDKLVETRRNRALEEGAYYEKHHIVMKSMGGSDDNINIVFLTAREHFLAHWLLWRIHRNVQTACAFSMMCRGKTISSRAFQESREAFSAVQSGKPKPYMSKQWENLSKDERSERAKKIWAKRRENNTHHRRTDIKLSEEAKYNMKEAARLRKLK